MDREFNYNLEKIFNILIKNYEKNEIKKHELSECLNIKIDDISEIIKIHDKNRNLQCNCFLCRASECNKEQLLDLCKSELEYTKKELNKAIVYKTCWPYSNYAETVYNFIDYTGQYINDFVPELRIEYMDMIDLCIEKMKEINTEITNTIIVESGD